MGHNVLYFLKISRALINLLHIVHAIIFHRNLNHWNLLSCTISLQVKVVLFDLLCAIVFVEVL